MLIKRYKLFIYCIIYFTKEKERKVYWTKEDFLGIEPSTRFLKGDCSTNELKIEVTNKSLLLIKER